MIHGAGSTGRHIAADSRIRTAGRVPADTKYMYVKHAQQQGRARCRCAAPRATLFLVGSKLLEQSLGGMTKVAFAPPPDPAGLIRTGGVVRAGASQVVTGPFLAAR